MLELLEEVKTKKNSRDTFQPDYRFIVDVLKNKRPGRLPLYEHGIALGIMEKILEKPFTGLWHGNDADVKEFFKFYCRFFEAMTYDTVSFEIRINEALPYKGSFSSHKEGPIQSREDFEKYPWKEIPQRFWDLAHRRFTLFSECLPQGMKGVGGIGNGLLEVCENLVGYQNLAYMMEEDPQLFSDLFKKIGEVVLEIWTEFLKHYSEHFCVCRFGDDLGFKDSIPLAIKMIIKNILPQYRRVIKQIHLAGKPFLLHSGGNIFEAMDPLIHAGIGAKHANETSVAPFEKWISLYGDKIGLVGGFEVELLCQKSPEEIYDFILEKGQKYRNSACGYALGSNYTIPDYVPAEGYLAMVKAAQQIRFMETVL